MKIVTPLSSVENYIPLCEAGADNFFCGFIPYTWLKEYSNIEPMNRREFMYSSNICSLDDMIILKKMIEKYGVPVKIALNSHYYLESQYKILLPIIMQLMEIGFDTFIIADIALIIYLRSNNINCNIHLSGETAEVNSLSIDFFNQFNISRYIFHRKNSIEDMKSCIERNKIKNLEYEAFILNELCLYTGAFCNTLHCEELLPACHIPQKMSRLIEDECKFSSIERALSIIEKINRKSVYDNDNVYGFGKSGCGVCKIKKLKDVGITYLKVVGRGKKLEHLIEDIKILRQMCNAADRISDINEFEREIKVDYLENKCSGFCYYL